VENNNLTRVLKKNLTNKEKLKEKWWRTWWIKKRRDNMVEEKKEKKRNIFEHLQM
jgi:hypothetical protein